MHGSPTIYSLYDKYDRPKFGSHGAPWKHKNTLLKIIQRRSKYGYDSLKLQKMCKEYGFFEGLLLLYLDNGYIREAIEIVIFCDYLEGFKMLMNSENFNTSNVFTWRFLFKKLIESYKNDAEQLGTSF